MLRKLILVGMLTLVEQGSTLQVCRSISAPHATRHGLSSFTIRLQVCAGIATSFAFFSAHISTLPYRFLEDNMLKATTEIHLFILLLLVLAFKSNMEREEYDAHFYDLFATVLFVIFVPVFFLACVVHKWHTVLSDDVEATALTTYTAQLQAAFHRHRLGRDKAADRKLLGEYIAKVEDEVNSDYHVFISYRVRTEATFAKALYDALSEMTLAESGQKLRVYCPA